MLKQYGKVLLTLRDLGYEAREGSSILDFGCGNGSGVKGLRERGYEAYGCDLKLGEEGEIPALAGHGHVRLIETAPYRLPFDDDFFDIVYSCQVFEHVQNYRDALREIHRVLKPGGVSLHIFPSRYRPIESHFHVPLASVIQSYRYLYFWAKLGIRKDSQEGMSAEEVARYNYTALNERTNYLSKKKITSFVEEFFDEYEFCELAASRHSRLSALYPVFSRIPFASPLLSTFQTRILYFRKNRT
jgi:SAM-dependent methyltransferase